MWSKVSFHCLQLLFIKQEKSRFSLMLLSTWLCRTVKVTSLFFIILQSFITSFKQSTSIFCTTWCLFTGLSLWVYWFTPCNNSFTDALHSSCRTAHQMRERSDSLVANMALCSALLLLFVSGLFLPDFFNQQIIWQAKNTYTIEYHVLSVYPKPDIWRTPAPLCVKEHVRNQSGRSLDILPHCSVNAAKQTSMCHRSDPDDQAFTSL